MKNSLYQCYVSIGVKSEAQYLGIHGSNPAARFLYLATSSGKSVNFELSSKNCPCMGVLFGIHFSEKICILMMCIYGLQKVGKMLLNAVKHRAFHAQCFPNTQARSAKPHIKSRGFHVTWNPRLLSSNPRLQFCYPWIPRSFLEENISSVEKLFARQAIFNICVQ